MTYLSHTDRASGGSIGQTLSNLAQRWTQFRTHHRTLKELSALSDHELADIGIHRANIGDVARGFASRA